MKIACNCVLASLVILASSVQASAQQYTAEQMKQYVANLKAEIARRGARERALNEEIISLDADIEARIDSVMKMLSSKRDSTDSKALVHGLKEETIKGLQKSIEWYVYQRNKRAKDMKASYSQAPKEDLKKDVDALNERIDKRIEQIIDLTKSFTEHKEFREYSRYRHNDISYSVKTREAQRREQVHREGVREKARIVDELRDAIKLLETKNMQLESSISYTGVQATKNALRAEINTNKELIVKRRAQLQELIDDEGGGSTKTVSKDAAFEMDKLLDDVVEEIRRDYRKMQQLVVERDKARSLTKPWKDKLLKAEAALQQLESQESSRGQ